MKIAFVAPLISPLKEPHIGGAQVFLCDLAKALHARGHQVCIYAAETSRLEEIEIYHFPLASSGLHIEINSDQKIYFKKNTAYQAQAETFKKIYQSIAQEGYDIVHNHALDPPSFEESFKYSTPVIHTLHVGNLIPQMTEFIKNQFKKNKSTGTVAISKFVAKSYEKDFPVETIIINGVNLKNINFGDGGGDFLLFAGRICPEKGVKEAILIAAQSRKKIILAGPIHFSNYFDQEIEPLIRQYPDQIFYLGHLTQSELHEKIRQAQAVLVTSLWEEPFGLVAAEALASGTPVIAFKVGALPEIVEHEKTGFLVERGDVDSAAHYVSQVHLIDRKNCRKRMEDFFNFERMVKEYEKFYELKKDQAS